MKLLRPPKGYPSLDAFYAELPEVDRKLSREFDYGVHWTEPYAISGPRFRISLVHATGELYEVCEDEGSQMRGRVRVLAVFDDVDEAEFVLSGWAERCGPGGMRWLRDRLELAVAQYVCGACIARGRIPDYTFDDSRRCRECGHKAWSLNPEHERVRIRRPAEAIERAREHADCLEGTK